MKANIEKAAKILPFILIVFAVILVSGFITVNAQEQIKYSQKSVYDIKEDGWIYTFQIQYPTDNSDRTYIFDGYNLKYKQLDGYYIPVIDKTTNKEIDRVIPEYITLSISEHSRKDIENIVEYFNKMQFNHEITIDDIDMLNVSTISKDYLVDIFNRTINSPIKSEPGEYYQSNFVGKVNVPSTDISAPGEWQASYILDYGNIYKIDIEFIDENGNYLSEKQDSNELSLKESKIINQIKTAEKDVVVKQRASLNYNMTNKTTSSDNEDLQKLLLELQNRLNEE